VIVLSLAKLGRFLLNSTLRNIFTILLISAEKFLSFTISKTAFFNLRHHYLRILQKRGEPTKRDLSETPTR
jgi:hypothetical protein